MKHSREERKKYYSQFLGVRLKLLDKKEGLEFTHIESFYRCNFYFSEDNPVSRNYISSGLGEMIIPSNGKLEPGSESEVFWGDT